MRLKLVLIIVTVGLMILVAGCSKVSQEALDNANTALQEAKTAEAGQYAPNAFNSAQDTLNAALVLIEKENSRFSLVRSFGDANEKLAVSAKLANAARDSAVTRKEEISAEVQQALTDIKTALLEAKDLMNKAPVGKEGRIAQTVLKNELAVVETSLGEISTLLNNGNYFTALDKVKVAKEKVESIISELQAAIAKKASMTKSPGR